MAVSLCIALLTMPSVSYWGQFFAKNGLEWMAGPRAGWYEPSRGYPLAFSPLLAASADAGMARMVVKGLKASIPWFRSFHIA